MTNNSPQTMIRGGDCRGQNQRRGATAVEAALMIGVLLLVIIGALDVGLATARHDILATVARRLAREAALHGAGAMPERSTWGTTAYSGTAADSTEYAASIATDIATMAPGDVGVELRWPDGGNTVGDRIVVRLRYTHQGSILLGLGDGLPLEASCVIRVDN